LSYNGGKMNAIICHKGKKWDYIDTVIKQAEKVCTGEVMYLDDEYWEECGKAAEIFADKYVHLNSNSQKFELLCFQRWFVINEFVKSRGITEFCHIDSDVLLYTDLTKEAEQYRFADYTLSKRESPHVSFWFNMKALDDFVDFLDFVYSYPNMMFSKEIFQHYHNLKQNGMSGGVCDMTLLKTFADKRNYVCAETSGIVNGEMFDHNMTEVKGWVSDYGIKKIDFVDNMPVAYKIETVNGVKTEVPVKMKCLHCSGAAKDKITEFARL